MKLRRTCRDVTRLVLEGEDRALTRPERWSMRLHWLICSACSNFRQQAGTMRVAVDRWRKYRDES
ncbi:MAG: zf-HC2 domain-containing protein [Ideonella sp.]|jgi:hypothetical protein|nr:zf-HC2 domain-containing protein [Ideonella sp.]MBL0147198.1 zf-HC2 domain-containing protein [Ideonella sp.]